ncbi:alpha-galactosidase [Actinomarinicola tropica]|uniref:Alpha-galactosidase n=1 Tax=Actinomarinicola tropica TaxID=2789776 RepID=A0A5Q2RKA9_9ACTN|nr:alpha-galactosidase [Actinomarinicola tropica]QGG94836.1 melibiase [Actinomarinicola tropica]
MDEVEGDPLAVSDQAGTIVRVDAGRTGLVWAVDASGRLRQVTLGPGGTGRSPDVPVHLYPLAYPTFGEEPLREPALRVTHADGVTSTRLRVTSVTSAPVDGHARCGDLVHRVALVDRAAPLGVDLVVRTWPCHDLLEQWVEVRNAGDGAVQLHAAAAFAPTFAGSDPHLTHWGGGWAAEWTETTERLSPGTKVVASAGGVRPSLHRAPVVHLAPDGRASETEGSVAAVAVAWGGDVRFDAEVALHGQQRLVVGHQHVGAERRLDPGGSFESPHVLWTWSDAGTGPASRSLQRFVREEVVRDGARPRAVVANTWEAVGFALHPDRLATQIDRAAEIGAELFLLDDGWFGVDHPRDDDTTGLGDWEVDRRKLPDGLGPLVDRTLAAGMRFGLWVEPEMVNPASRLYAEHPDWVIGEPGRDRRTERSQLVLDLCRPEVRRFVVDTVGRILTEHPGISYLKWDANRDLTEPGSSAVPADRQSHLAVDRVRATWAVMAEIAERHPDVELMLCASGGGRSDPGTLRWFHELWTSDDTDPVDRVRIQWGASHLLPANVLGAHVTRWGQRPLAFACAVAMSGRFGFDLDLDALSPDDLALCRRATDDYSAIRDLVQQGDHHRLVSPVGSDRCAVGYTDPRTGDGVVFLFRLAEGADGDEPEPPPVRVPWLDPHGDRAAIDRTPGGDHAALTVTGGRVAWPTGPAPCATVLHIPAVAPDR